MPTFTVPDEKIHVGDVGTALVAEIVEWDEEEQAYIPVDVSDASQILIYLTKPNGNTFTTLTKTGVLDTNGINGKVKYVTEAGDLSIKGTWKIQAYVAGVDGWSGSSLEATFQVNSSRHG